MDDPLGMEVKTIPDSAISATSMESPAYHPSNARLHLNIGGGGWCADSSLAEQPQYLQVDYESNFLLTAVATQGIKSDASCVTQYYLSTTIDHNIWIYVHDFTGKKVRVDFRCCCHISSLWTLAVVAWAWIYCLGTASLYWLKWALEGHNPHTKRQRPAISLFNILWKTLLTN